MLVCANCPGKSKVDISLAASTWKPVVCCRCPGPKMRYLAGVPRLINEVRTLPPGLPFQLDSVYKLSSAQWVRFVRVQCPLWGVPGPMMRYLCKNGATHRPARRLRLCSQALQGPLWCMWQRFFGPYTVYEVWRNGFHFHVVVLWYCICTFEIRKEKICCSQCLLVPLFWGKFSSSRTRSLTVDILA